MKNEFEILFENKYTETEDISTKSQFIIKEPAPGGGFIETTFMNGKGLVEYMDRTKILRDDNYPFPTTTALIYELIRKFFPHNIGV